ncbi:hypothetical protein [Bradyrhizobium sp. SZCCHNR1093]|uniref:hypothetical protein n=1 Tax=Bradyrhizobium sp. SZCCHNR1093 TaxID=3057368 RepID=UPI0028ED317E|nr:hypothetical protein [Bradyrhizobium sp. SZCCHNR1093]
MEEADREFEQLKLLFDYTKFHIGLYATVATIFGGLYSASDKVPLKFNPFWLVLSIICIFMAGIAGGTIASSIPGYTSYAKFWSSKIGPFRSKLITAENWTYIEHSAFWLAVFLAFLSIMCGWPSHATGSQQQKAALSADAVGVGVNCTTLAQSAPFALNRRGYTEFSAVDDWMIKPLEPYPWSP